MSKQATIFGEECPEKIKPGLDIKPVFNVPDDILQTRLLALDVSTYTGFCTRSASGVWNLSPKRDESTGMRVLRFKGKLQEVIKIEWINLIVFERAAGFHKNALIVEAELLGVLKLVCEENKIQYRAYSPSEIKKFATGKGNAKKTQMIEAAQQKFGYIGNDDNQADAICLYHLAKHDLGL